MFVCEACGYTSPDWLGRCPNCSEYGTLQQESGPDGDGPSDTPAKPPASTQSLSDLTAEDLPRLTSGLSELDRVLGGGVVPGSVVLIGGPPGIGKSTLLLQWAAEWSMEEGPVLYVNGEESAPQIARRARRLGCEPDDLELVNPSCVEEVTEHLTEWKPSLIFVDSIQTVTSEESGGMPGSVAQLRAVTTAVVDAAKQSHVPVVLIGHVTKEGDIGGPRRLEHMVDTVLYFDDSARGYRFLRSAKNRFGPTGELGIFEMTGEGLRPVPDPGQYFRPEGDPQSGRMLTVSMEGSRPLVVEVQALVTPSRYGTPQRSATGLASRRLVMLVAVLEKKLGLEMGDRDVFVNVAGGLRLDDPGTDLAVALALASSRRDHVLPAGAVGLGEIGLTGRVRPPSQASRRIREARRLQYEPVVTAPPPHDVSGDDGALQSVDDLRGAMEALA